MKTKNKQKKSDRKVYCKFPFHSCLFLKPFLLCFLLMFLPPSFDRMILKESKNRQEVKRKVNENGKTLLTYFIVPITEPAHNQLDCLPRPGCCLLVPRHETFSELPAFITVWLFAVLTLLPVEHSSLSFSCTDNMK